MNLQTKEDYAEAKKLLKELTWKRDNMRGSDSFTQHMKMHVSLLEAVLLAYRRANNIFEVGDKVVWRESLSIISSLMEIESLDGDTWGIRHATNEEIQAGRRLSKIKCWSCDKEMSHSDRAENDGFCIHCNAEIEL